MSGFLLDTNCISELVKPQPERRVIDWIEGTEESLLHLSVLTLGEIRKGAAGLEPGKRRLRLETWLATDLRVRFKDRILPIDEPVADRWGVIACEAKRTGKALTLTLIDGLLAATALHYGLTVVSRDDGDFRGVRVPVLNPWA